MWKLLYNAQMVQCDNAGNPNGALYSFGGTQVTGAMTPQTSDLNALATAMGTDITTQLTALFPVDVDRDQSNDGTGGGD